MSDVGRDAGDRWAGGGRRRVEGRWLGARWHRTEGIVQDVRTYDEGGIAVYYALGFCELVKRRYRDPAKRGREDAIVMAMELLSGDIDKMPPL